jgi:hypothetical protein
MLNCRARHCNHSYDSGQSFSYLASPLLVIRVKVPILLEEKIKACAGLIGRTFDKAWDFSL